MSRLANIEHQIGVARKDLNEAKLAQSKIEIVLIDDPSNKTAHEESRALDQEIGEHQRRIARLEGAQAEAARIDAEEAKKASLGVLKAEFANVETRMAKQREVAAALISAVEQLTPLLAEYEALAADQKNSAWAITRGSFGGNYKLAERHFSSGLVDSVKGTSARAAIISALYATGLGRTRGLHMAPWVEIISCGASRPLDEEMNRAQSGALQKLGKLIDRREAELKGKGEDVPTQADRFIKNGKLAQEHRERVLRKARERAGAAQ